MGVFRDEAFEEQLRGLGADLPRLDDAIRYIEHQLSEHPESGVASEIPGIYVAHARLPHAGELARFSIFYTFDGKDVTFRVLRRAP